MPLLPPSCRPETAALALNPRVRASASPAARAVLDEAGFEAARAAIRSWPGYAPTPLRSLDGLARAAGLAGALAAAGCPGLAESSGLGPESRVLVLGTEGATDPELRRAIVGRAPEEVVARRGGEA